MRDVFFTILAIWLVYRIWNALQANNTRSQHNAANKEKKVGDVSVDYVPPQKNKNDNDGEYVDYEEIKEK